MSLLLNRIGVFTLTPYEGMQEIGSCTQNGFHPHKPNGVRPSYLLLSI